MKILKRVGAVLGAVALSVSLAAPASADVVRGWHKGQVKIVAAGTDAMGGDGWWNRNSEWIRIANEGTEPVDITGWHTADRWRVTTSDKTTCNTFRFSVENVDSTLVSEGRVVLPAGHSVVVYTGAGTARPWNGGKWHAVYMDHKCGHKGHYINNNRDTLYLMHGDEVVSRAYFDRQGGYEADFR